MVLWAAAVMHIVKTIVYGKLNLITWEGLIVGTGIGLAMMAGVVKNKYQMLKKSFKAIMKKNPEIDASYIIMPFDLKKETGKGRLKVHASLDGVPYDGSIVNMGLKNSDGSICYMLGIPKIIRNKTGKTFGDELEVVIEEKS